jgi:hypothetical protein
MLVELHPFDCVTLAEKPPVGALLRRSVKQPGKPLNWDANRASIRQMHGEPLIVHVDVSCDGLSFKYQSSHPTPS